MALNEQQIDMIKMYVEVHSQQDGLAKPRKIFSEIKTLIDLDYEKFNLALTYLIRTDRLGSFSIWPDGNIYPQGKEPVLEKSEHYYGHQIPVSVITIAGQKYNIYFATKQALQTLLSGVLHSKESSDGAVEFDNKHYQCDTNVLKRFIEAFYDVEPRTV